MTKQDFNALWEYAERLEKTEKGSKLYQEVKALLLETVKEMVK